MSSRGQHIAGTQHPRGLTWIDVYAIPTIVRPSCARGAHNRLVYHRPNADDAARRRRRGPRARRPAAATRTASRHDGRRGGDHRVSNDLDGEETCSLDASVTQWLCAPARCNPSDGRRAREASVGDASNLARGTARMLVRATFATHSDTGIRADRSARLRQDDGREAALGVVHDDRGQEVCDRGGARSRMLLRRRYV